MNINARYSLITSRTVNSSTDTGLSGLFMYLASYCSTLCSYNSSASFCGYDNWFLFWFFIVYQMLQFILLRLYIISVLLGTFIVKTHLALPSQHTELSGLHCCLELRSGSECQMKCDFQLTVVTFSKTSLLPLACITLTSTRFRIYAKH